MEELYSEKALRRLDIWEVEGRAGGDQTVVNYILGVSYASGPWIESYVTEMYPCTWHLLQISELQIIFKATLISPS